MKHLIRWFLLIPLPLFGAFAPAKQSRHARSCFCWDSVIINVMRSQTRRTGGYLLHESSDPNSSSDPPFFYNDFDDWDYPIGSSSYGGTAEGPSKETKGEEEEKWTAGTVLSTALIRRMSQMQLRDFQQQLQLTLNWQSGSWKVRGLAVDSKQDAMVCCLSVTPMEEDWVIPTTTTTTSSRGRPASGGSVIMADILWVGRTDGTVLAVQLGSSSWTQLRTKQGSQAQSSRSMDDEGTLNEMEPTDSIIPPTEHDNDPSSILYQVSAGNQPVVSIQHYDNYLFTSVRGSQGSIQVWMIPEEEDEELEEEETNNIPTLLSVSTLTGIHGDDLIFLKVIPLPMSRHQQQAANGTSGAFVLLTVATDGSLAVWDTNTSTCLRRYHVTGNDGTGEHLILTSATMVSDAYLVLGSTTGQIWVYRIADLLVLPVPLQETAASSSATITENDRSKHHDAQVRLQPICHWKASMDGSAITAVVSTATGRPVGGDNRQTDGRYSIRRRFFLVTGDAKGTVKQWEILERTSPSRETDGTNDEGGSSGDSVVVDYWPKLPTQRLTDRKIHILSKGCTSDSQRRITSVALHPHSVLAADGTGTVTAWNAQTGSESFQVPGMSSAVQNLLLLRENLLITDGMHNVICIHDFDFSFDAAMDDTDFDAGDDYLGKL